MSVKDFQAPEQYPILKRIHDKHDPSFPRYPYTDHSIIRSIDIKSNTGLIVDVDEPCYSICTYAGGIGSAYDAFRIFANAAILGEENPTLVEIGRECDGLILFSDNAPIEDCQLTQRSNNQCNLVKEGLRKFITANSPDFTDFIELQARLRASKPLIDAALGKTWPDSKFDMNHFSANYNFSHVYTDRSDEIPLITNRRTVEYGFATKDHGTTANITLDASVTVPMAEGYISLQQWESLRFHHLDARLYDYRDGRYSDHKYVFGDDKPLALTWSHVFDEIKKLYQ